MCTVLAGVRLAVDSAAVLEPEATPASSRTCAIPAAKGKDSCPKGTHILNIDTMCCHERARCSSMRPEAICPVVSHTVKPNADEIRCAYDECTLTMDLAKCCDAKTVPDAEHEGDADWC